MRLWLSRLVAVLALAMSVGGAVLVMTERGLEQKVVGTPIFFVGALLSVVPSILIENSYESLKIKGIRIR